MGRIAAAVDCHDGGLRALWGRRHAGSLRAIMLAVVLFVVVAIFTYADMAAYEDVVYFDVPRGVLDYALWQGVLEAFAHPALAVGLAAIHAYLNEGYLPAILLAIAPILGTSIWIYSGPFPGPYVLTLAPFIGEWGWVQTVARFAALWATVGFLLGILVRWLRTEFLDLPEPMS